MSLDALDLRRVVEEIHFQVRHESQGNGKSALPASNAHGSVSFEALRRSYEHLCALRNSIGEMPPCPKTLRARLASHLVRIVQRMLFWHTPQVAAVQDAITDAIGELIRVVDQQSGAIWRQGLGEPGLGPASSRRRDARKDAPPPGSYEFQFALLNRFRGSEEDVKNKLRVYLGAIRAISPPPPPGGTWLDVGCGRGEWLAVAREAGHQPRGVDGNPIAVAHCVSRGLQAECGDALDCLSALPDGSAAVISAFHVLEHLPHPDTIACIQASARALQPGGLLILEMPNPANLSVGAHHFWNDPTHQRPLPVQLTEFLLEYYHLRVARRLDLNPPAPTEQLPFQQLHFVERINQQLCGPRDYGLIAQK